MMRKKGKKNAQLHVVFSESFDENRGRGKWTSRRQDSVVWETTVFDHRIFRAAWGVPGDFGFQLLFGDIGFFLRSADCFPHLTFCGVFSTNLNVLLAICMGLWDDLKLERLSIKTNDLDNEGYDVFLYLQFVSLRTHGLQTPKLYFPGARAPISHGAFPRISESRSPKDRQMFWAMLQSNLSGGFCRTSLGHFWGEEGYGIQNMFGRIFLFLQMFVVEIETVLVWKDINWRTRPANHFHDFNFFNTLVTPVLLAESNMSKSLGKILYQNNQPISEINP